MPLASIVSMLSLYAANGATWFLPGVVMSAVLTALEVGVLVWICVQVLRTKAALRTADYMRHRTKQIGFRFFLYHNLTFYLVYWACYLVLLLLMPVGAQVLAIRLGFSSYFEVQYVLLGPNVLMLVYTTVQAYVNLPSDAIGWRGWFAPQMPASRGDLAPIMYRARERPSRSPAAVSESAVNTFTMQTHVAMLNFAWMVYYYGTEKMGALQRQHDVLRHRVDKFIRHDETDTSVLLLDAHDRIIISFKGTSSLRNLRTDVKAFRLRADRVAPLPAVGRGGGGGRCRHPVDGGGRVVAPKPGRAAVGAAAQGLCASVPGGGAGPHGRPPPPVRAAPAARLSHGPLPRGEPRDALQLGYCAQARPRAAGPVCEHLWRPARRQPRLSRRL
eukprot:TRINITY_DN4569_c1_g1_i1.p1 TRINITY_DN4569_c1_g1~~TRINITY_DN4569_c1_g1_i1.p1  ORF type:complete len:387 (-),score=115.72 TRINITY_DN4569_c1_g1_i1:625-1785(-)